MKIKRQIWNQISENLIYKALVIALLFLDYVSKISVYTRVIGYKPFWMFI